MQRTIRFVIFFALFVLVLNILVLDYFLVKQRSDLLDFQTRLTTLSDSFKIIGARFNLYPTSNTPGTGGTNQPTADELKQFLSGDVCPNSCINLIGVATISAGISSGEGSSRLSTSQLISSGTLANPTSVGGDYIIPIGGGTVTAANNSWANPLNIDTAQVTFDAGNYHNIKQAYFEAIIFMPAPSGELHARLFDKTTPNVFFNSEVLTTSGTAQLFTVPINLSAGTKTYTVQMYSTLTTGTLSQAMIRIVTQ